jgi:Zn-dependent protease/CBS domain-containing protein
VAAPPAADSVSPVFSRAFRIGSIGGIAVRIDPSWFLVVLLFAFGFWGWFATRYGHPGAVSVTLAVAAAALFFLSVLAHELGHALEAQHRGVEVGGITLFLFGGVTETRFDVERPFDEFALSAVGPYVSFVAAAVFGLIATGAGAVDLDVVAHLAGVLGWLNLVLAVFNLLPGAPLDGGRILRAIVWKVTGDRPRSVRLAARAGQALGGVVAVAGLYQALVLGDWVAGFFNAFIGWFLFAAAGSEHRHTALRTLLEDRDLGSLIGRPPAALPADLPVDEVAAQMARSDRDVHPVEDHGEVVGVVHVSDLRAGPEAEPTAGSLRTVMRPLSSVSTMPASMPVLEAIERIDRGDVVALLGESDEVVGLFTYEDLDRRLRQVRTLEEGPPEARVGAAEPHLPEEPA